MPVNALSMDGFMSFDRIDSDFSSRGTRCAGWLYRPKGIKRPPLVIMAHGFAAERAFGLPAFAERFADIGMAVLLFDYRTFGSSDGLPRNNVDPIHHGQDWDAAIAHGRSLSDVDPERVTLWGTSFSGAHIVCAAARDSNIQSLIGLVPFSGVDPDTSHLPWTDYFKYMMAAMWDRLKTATTGEPHYIPVIGPPGSLSALNTLECLPGYMAMVPEGMKLDNRTPAKAMMNFFTYSPLSAAQSVNCPTLLIAGEYDSLVPLSSVERLSEAIIRSELVKLKCNHFDPYIGEWFEKNVSIQTDFLKRHLVA